MKVETVVDRALEANLPPNQAEIVGRKQSKNGHTKLIRELNQKFTGQPE